MPDTHTYTHLYPRFIACIDTFLLHVYRSVSLARMWRYMQFAYLFHQYAKSFLSTDGRIADSAVRHPGVERTFSSCEYQNLRHYRQIGYCVLLCFYCASVNDLSLLFFRQDLFYNSCLIYNYHWFSSGMSWLMPIVPIY